MMIRQRRFITLIIVYLLISISILFYTATGVYGAQTPETEGARAEWMNAVPVGTLEDLADFQTNLPIVVIDVGGQEFRRVKVWDSKKQGYNHIDYDPYVEGTIQLIDTGIGINHLADAPQIESNIQTRIRGCSSQSYPKEQYLIKLFNEDGTKNPQSLLGMSSDHEWILNISYIDKTLVRNYLAYTVSARVMDYASDVRYCEVFFRNNDIYQYNGVYLLIEKSKRGASKIPITKYDPRFAESAYILLRDRFDDKALILNTYGTQHGFTDEYLMVEYPSKNEITDETIQFIENDINKFEEALFAENDKDFLKYKNYVNIESFADYFILNEFFANYDATKHSVYMYKDIKGKLTMGPVWDFDSAIDNYYPHKLKIDSTAMHDGVWFRQMLRDGDFVKLIINRYAALREDILSDTSIDAVIDEAVRIITPAQVRDWHRWDYNSVYDAQFTGNVRVTLLPLTGNRWEYGEAIEQCKQTLHAHGGWMDEHLDSLYQFSTIEPTDGRSEWFGSSMAGITLIAFFISVFLVQKC